MSLPNPVKTPMNAVRGETTVAADGDKFGIILK
jgi:hypothetical protein